ncbi:hypothetical protein ABBQ32_000098 [Trebouxia sp. C0010 RCD-2024]
MMTRLRIKTSDGKLERITLPNNSTLRELKELIARDVLHNSGTTSVKLSLNNKVELEGTPKDTLQAAGICSGDLLWVMGPANHKTSGASSDRLGKPNTNTSVPGSAPKPAKSATTRKNAAVPSEASAQISCLSSFEEDAVQIPKQDGERPEAKPSYPELLQRVLDSCPEATPRPHQLMLLTVHAVMLETGMQLAHQDSKYALPDGTLSRCSNVCQLEYVLQQRQQQEVCEIKYIGLGAGLACIAAFNGSQVVTLNVSLTHHLHVPRQQPQGGHSELATSAFTDLQQLWTELKDRLALKVFASLRQSAGLPPPLGLLSLPTELKTKILSSLQAQDLAVMECCCTELRRLASTDLFWQPLFHMEFGFVTSYEGYQAIQRGWQHVYALKYVDREARRQQSRRRPRLTAFPGRGIFAPPGPPAGITGGDYDRLPQPFLGGTPGMFGGGIGGSTFGGSGPPSAFFLGGRGTGRAARAAGNFRLA